MMNFLDKKIKNRKKIGTPTKKIKMNEDPIVSDFQIPLKSLVFIKNISISEKQNLMVNIKGPKQFQVGNFNVENTFSIFNSNKQNDPFQMNWGKDNDEEQESLKVTSKLRKRLNSVQKSPSFQYDDMLADLNLTKNNSTFPIANFVQQHNQDIGQNVYLTQLLKLKSKISFTDVNNQNRELLRKSRIGQGQDQNRLQKDYEIKKNLRKSNPNKQGFICLNKLEKIFYYVKKIGLGSYREKLPRKWSNDMADQTESLTNLSQSKVQVKNDQYLSLVSEQIKLYNKDQDGCLIRFYQEWIENNFIYMIYELGTYSLAEKSHTRQRLPESEVWSLLFDSADSLKFIYEQGKVHMNITPGNIIKCRGKYKLSDPFASVQHLERQLQKINCKKEAFYCAPQLIEFKSYVEGIQFVKCQVYSLGMSILQNISTLPVFLKNQSLSELKVHFKKQMHGYSSCLKRLLLRTIQKNPQKRPLLDQLLCSNMQENQISSKLIKNQVKFKRSNSF